MMVCLLTAALLSATPETRWHAVVIGNNTSPTQGRATLQYADDDALRYALTLSPVVPAGRLHLLARPDRDTTRFEIFGVTPTSAPTSGAVAEAFATVAQQVKTARGEGVRAGVYVFFAGHGDVEEGQGFLELEDGRLTGKTLEKHLASLGADEVHVVLDSCNSFFVLSPRKPGGRRFATSKDVVDGLGRALPGVGVFLSTSADAESWEWSELQAGVFSYLVRSALAGPADLDGDGTITYGELRRFVAIAAQDVRNPRLRPVVFARGPAGDDARPFFVLPTSGVGGVSAKATDGPLRLSLKDADGTRWLEAHLEPGQAFVVQVPKALSAVLQVERAGASERLALPDAAVTPLEALTPAGPTGPLSSRGLSPSLSALFSTPFGATSAARLDAESSGADGAFGVTDEEFRRLIELVERLATLEQNDRTRGAVTGGVWALGFITVGTVGVLSKDLPCVDWCDLREDGWGLIATGVLGGGLLVAEALLSNSARQGSVGLLDRYRTASREAGFSKRHFAEYVEREFLLQLHRRQQQLAVEKVALWVGIGLTLGLAVVEPLDAIAERRPFSFSSVVSNTAMVGALALQLAGVTWRSDERERLMTGWLEGVRGAPVPPVRVGLAPLPGGAGLTLRASF
jgi:hypothetical protein